MDDHYFETKNAILEDLLLKGIEFELAVKTINSSNDMFYIYQQLGIQIPKHFQVDIEGLPSRFINPPPGPPRMPSFPPGAPRPQSFPPSPPSPPRMAETVSSFPTESLNPQSLGKPNHPQPNPSTTTPVSITSSNPSNLSPTSSQLQVLSKQTKNPLIFSQDNLSQSSFNPEISDNQGHFRQYSSQSIEEKIDPGLLMSKDLLLNTTIKSMNLESFKEKPVTLMYQDLPSGFSYGFAHEGFVEYFEDDVYDDYQEIDFDFDKPETIPEAQVVFDIGLNGNFNVFQHFPRILGSEIKEVEIEQSLMIRYSYENFKGI